MNPYRFYESIRDYEKQDETKLFNLVSGEPGWVQSPWYDNLLGEIFTWSAEDFDVFIEGVKRGENVKFFPGAQGNSRGLIELMQVKGNNFYILKSHLNPPQEIKYSSGYYMKTYYMEGVYDEYYSIVYISDEELPLLVERLEGVKKELKIDNELGRQLQVDYIKRCQQEKEKRELAWKTGNIKPSPALVSLLSYDLQDIMVMGNMFPEKNPKPHLVANQKKSNKFRYKSKRTSTSKRQSKSR